MDVLYIVFGALLVLGLAWSHYWAYMRGHRSGESKIYWSFYLPMASRFERNRREILKLALLDDRTAAQQNVILFLDKRRLWNKAMKHALKSRKRLKEIRRLKDPIPLFSKTMHVLEYLHRVKPK